MVISQKKNNQSVFNFCLFQFAFEMICKINFIILVFFVIFTKSNYVIESTDENFTDDVSKSNTTLVMFYATW